MASRRALKIPMRRAAGGGPPVILPVTLG
jgi:hypothetical protein